MDKVSTDWPEAGRKADATRVLNLYRQSFDNDAKRLARRRSIEALKAAGVSTVVCLWGGGYDADELVAAGMRVIAVDNGSMIVMDGDREVSTVRKQRALRYAAEAGGYEWRWGDVRRFLPEADGALLDFHGPWAADKRRIINAARHMTAVVVVLVPSRDVSADASSAHERQMAYQLFLKMSWSDRPSWEAMSANGHVRRLTDYHEDQGRHVFVYLLCHKHVKLAVMTGNERAKMRRDVQRRVRAKSRAYYHRLDADGKARWMARCRHNDHLRTGKLPVLPCQVCGEQREPTQCLLCGDVIPYELALHSARYCSVGCRAQRKADGQRARNLSRPRAARTAMCVRCGKEFQPSAGNNLRKPLCGPICRDASNKERKAEWYRRRVAAVSGTAAEAISSVVAA